jgi:hypothetical protein
MSDSGAGVKLFFLCVFLGCFSIITWIWGWEFMFAVKIFVTTLLGLIGVLYLLIFIKELL